ncbi:MAG: hypothetical protein RMJ55_07005 [Roseiflexaceae bacterium]|nr:hypothetical protein [Roseiflexaceae bacterium]
MPANALLLAAIFGDDMSDLAQFVNRGKDIQFLLLAVTRNDAHGQNACNAYLRIALAAGGGVSLPPNLVRELKRHRDVVLECLEQNSVLLGEDLCERSAAAIIQQNAKPSSISVTRKSVAVAAANRIAALGTNGWRRLDGRTRFRLITAVERDAIAASSALAVLLPILAVGKSVRDRLFQCVACNSVAAADLIGNLGISGFLTATERNTLIKAVACSSYAARTALAVLFDKLDYPDRKQLLDTVARNPVMASASLAELYRQLDLCQRQTLLDAVAKHHLAAVEFVRRLGANSWLQLPKNERDALIAAIKNNTNASLHFIAELGADGWQQLTRDQQRMLLRTLIPQEDVAAYLRHKNVVWHDCLMAWLPDANSSPDLIDAWHSALNNGQLPPNVSAIIALLFPRTSSCRQRRHSTRQP